MSIRPSFKFAGVLVTAVLVGALALYWRAATPERANAVAQQPTRGGDLVAALRSDPRTFNPLVAADETSALLASLLQARLVRVNRATFELEPWLAERWESSPDGRSHTLHLRPGLTWSDGTPLTSADVLFTLQAVHDKTLGSPLADTLMVGGQPIEASAPDPNTVVLTFAAPSGPGLRLLDALPILPRHKLAAALAAGTLRTAWQTDAAPAEIVGAGPFVLSSYEPGQRLTLTRNARYWRKAADGTALPYLDRLLIDIVPDENAGMVRLQAGTVDLLQSELRPEDWVSVRRAEEQGVLKMIELGVGTDPDAFWFRLKPDAWKGDPRFAFVSRREFRQALSHAVDREDFAQTVYFGEAVPIWGPITPGNRLWFTPNLPRYAPDLAKARSLLQSIGLEDRDGNGIVENAAGTEARFTVLTQRGVGSYERGTTVLKERAAMIGIALDIVPLEAKTMIGRMLASDYEAIYMRVLMTDLDPAGNMDMWLSSGQAHFWNLAQTTPATEWERRIDTLMLEQAAAVDAERRRELFNDVQRIFAENLPVLYFAAPRLYYAHSARLVGVVPSVLRPPVLWNADALGVNGSAGDD